MSAEDDAALAAEYVLGLLDAPELAAAEARLGRDPAFRDLVRDWSEGLAALADEIPAVAPPARLRAAVERRLWPEPARRRPWPRSLSWLLGGVVAAGLAVLALDPGLLRPGPFDYDARIVAQDGSLVVEARYDEDARRLELRRTAGAVPEGRDLELWLIQGEVVTSLGVIPRAETGAIEVVPALAGGFEDSTLALSVEPVGGSPTGVATGPVVAVGSVVER
ncbi:anti-sigma factor [Rubellimicrobium aerolatum]|uniref:Regulator of SigK n=1 Tax=Rubellimicrobium aerolatum TaxID=490979 RepID=A0ABW0S5M3_9RHOB|nr:anti-sigma factor [Rubellimicrobium aerolatum]MBP1804590.1 anti-sigma-K factor RskA [Rubellimicrobium aerolatum]